MRALSLAVACCIGGCGTMAPAPPPDGGALDGGSDGGPLWEGRVALPFEGELHWADGDSAQGPVAGANFSGGVGTIVYHGATLDAAIYREIPFAPYDLAAIVATTPTNLIVLYAYCQNGAISNWYFESLDEPVTVQLVGSPGTCMLPHTPTMADMRFAVWNGPPSDLQHALNATVTGANVSIDQGVGSATVGGVAYDVVAFDWVDCSACGSGGWYELHSLLRHGPQVSFGIFYLVNNMPAEVSLDYGFRFDLPSHEPPSTKFAATWILH